MTGRKLGDVRLRSRLLNRKLEITGVAVTSAAAYGLATAHCWRAFATHPSPDAVRCLEMAEDRGLEPVASTLIVRFARKLDANAIAGRWALDAGRWGRRVLRLPARWACSDLSGNGGLFTCALPARRPAIREAN